MSLKPWEQTWNGRGWRDMPPYCGSDDEKKLNFFFWRRGTLDVEDEVKCEDLAKDGIVEIVDGAERRPLPRLVSSFKRRFKLSGRRASPRRDEPLMLKVGRPVVLTEADQAWRMRLRMKLGEARQGHLHAISTIAVKAEVKYMTLSSFIRTGTGICTETLQRVEKVVLEYLAGQIPLRPMNVGKPKGYRVQTPPGCVPFKEWLMDRAAERKVKLHTMRAYFLRHPDKLPELVRVHNKCFFVRVQEVAA